jgi:hypothetical protein
MDGFHGHKDTGTRKTYRQTDRMRRARQIDETRQTDDRDRHAGSQAHGNTDRHIEQNVLAVGQTDREHKIRQAGGRAGRQTGRQAGLIEAGLAVGQTACSSACLPACLSVCTSVCPSPGSENPPRLGWR